MKKYQSTPNLQFPIPKRTLFPDIWGVGSWELEVDVGFFSTAPRPASRVPRPPSNRRQLHREDHLAREVVQLRGQGARARRNLQRPEELKAVARRAVALHPLRD